MVEVGRRAVGTLGVGEDAVGRDEQDPPVAGPVTPSPCLRLVPLPTGVATTLEDADELYLALSARDVEAQVTPYGGQGWIRLSGAAYNEAEDYERLADVLPAVLPTLHRAGAAPTT